MPEPPIFEVLGMVGTILKYTWWFLLPIGLYSIFKPVWISYATNVLFFGSEIKQTLLKIKIPKDMLVNPKAMENVIIGLLGSGRTITKYREIMFGRLQDYFSLEIVGQEGDVSFYILTPYRSIKLVEKLIYGQFPDVEVEIAKEDYFSKIPSTIPDENWNMWGTKLILANEDCRPLTTYPFFEDKQEGEISDPMAAVFESMGSLGPGENLILQIQVGQPPLDWRNKGEKSIEKVLEKYNMGPLADYTEEGTFMKILPYHEQELVKSIHSKMNKPAVGAQILVTYIARREVYNDISMSAITGALRQMESLHNSLQTDKYYTTTAYHAFGKTRRTYRQRRLLKLLQERDMQGTINVLTGEEVATIFHFPTPTTKVPSVPHLDSKRAPAPTNLPLGE
jgi:hypothetical protein